MPRDTRPLFVRVRMTHSSRCHPSSWFCSLPLPLLFFAGFRCCSRFPAPLRCSDRPLLRSLGTIPAYFFTLTGTARQGSVRSKASTSVRSLYSMCWAWNSSVEYGESIHRRIVAAESYNFLLRGIQSHSELAEPLKSGPWPETHQAVCAPVTRNL